MKRRSARALWTAKLLGKPLPAPTTLPSLSIPRAFGGRILGVDPSLRGTGLAVVDVAPGGTMHLVASTTIRCRSGWTAYRCLAELATLTAEWVAQYSPHHAALEETIYVQNFRTAQIMGLARGAILGQIGRAGLESHEYAPSRIKQAITGHGRASKEQVQRFVAQLLRREDILPADEADAAAVALCHALTHRPTAAPPDG